MNPNAVLIDGETGMVSVSHMINCARPDVNDTNLLRTIRNKLERVADGPQLSKHVLNERKMSTAPLDLCYHIVDNEWDNWRENSGTAFKLSLRERVESVLASSQSEQQQSQGRVGQEQQRQEQAQEQEQVRQQEPPVEQQAEVPDLQEDLKRAGIIGDVRVDNTSLRVSTIDAIRLVCPDADANYAGQMLIRLMEKDNEECGNSSVAGMDACNYVPIADRVERMCINGGGRETPVSDAKTTVEIMFLLPTGKAREFRRQSAQTICRVLGGDVSLCEEIETRCLRLQSTEEGRAYQQFMTGEEPQVKKPRFGPPIMLHASDEQYSSFLNTGVKHELAMWNSQQAHKLATSNPQHEHELVTRKTKSIHAEMRTEVDVVLSMKEAFESIRPLGDTENIELCDKVTDIQYRTFRKMGGTTSGSGAAIAPAENALTVATATAVCC